MVVFNSKFLTMPEKVYISLGSNIGNRFYYLQQAKEQIIKLLKRCQLSIIIETEAILQKNAPSDWNTPYLNMVISGFFDGHAEALLKELENIEFQIGKRKTNKTWAPRVIDLDILLFGEQVINTNNLTIPHKELLNRPFLLHLLAMMDCNLKTPNTKQYVSDISAQNYLNNKIKFTSSHTLTSCLFGIINLTTDSFASSDNTINYEQSLQKTINMAREGATVIDIGAQATNLNAKTITTEEEMHRITVFLDMLNDYQSKHHYPFNISIDTFNEEVIKNIINKYNILYINSVTDKISIKTLKLISQSNTGIIITHSSNIPVSKQDFPPHKVDILDTVIQWGKSQIKILTQCGFKQESIIIDVGIGFGKSYYQSIHLLKNIKKIKQNLGCKIMVGHSRKGVISAYSNQQASKRDLESIAISSHLDKECVDYLRVHNIKDHQRFFLANIIQNPVL